jgi:hypothetical protein
MTGHSVMAIISLHATDKGGLHSSLPSGTPSLVLEFPDEGPIQLGGVIQAQAGGLLEPGMSNRWVTINFWADEARLFAVPGVTFVLWYGGQVGCGRVELVMGPFPNQEA